MFIPSPLPEPQRIVAIDQFQVCPRLDLKCRIDYATDLLEGVARTFESSARSYSDNTGPMIVTPGTGHAAWAGYAPRVIVGPAGVAQSRLTA